MPRTREVERTTLLCWSVPWTTLSLFATLKTLYTVYHTLKDNQTRASRTNSISHSTSVFNRGPRIPRLRSRSSADSNSNNDTGVRTTLCCTAVSSVCFTSALLVWMTAYTIYIYRLHWKGQFKNAKETSEASHRIWNNLIIYFSVTPAIQLVGYTSLVLTFFLRLSSVFTIEHKALMTFRIINAMNLSLIICAFIAFFIWDPSMAIFCIIPVILNYTVMACWVSCKFLTNTRALIARNSSHDINAMSLDLVNSALRLTVLTWIAQSSTLVSGSFWILWLSNPDSPMFGLFLGFSTIVDSSVNVCCLMAMQSRNQAYYLVVFRRLHNWLLQKLIDTNVSAK